MRFTRHKYVTFYFLTLISSGLILGSVSIAGQDSLPNPPPTPPKTSEKPNGKPKTNQQDTKDPQAAPGPLIYAKQSNENSSQTSDKSSTNWWIVAFTGALVVIGAAQAGIYYRQTKYMRQGLILTKQAADAADKSLQLTERAWLIVRFDMPPRLEWPKPIEIRYVILNTGRSIARLKHVETLVTTDHGFPNLPVISVDRSIYNTTKVVIFPNTPIEQSGEPARVIQAQTYEAIKNGDVKLIVRGFIVYDDIFNIRHVTKFCEVYSPIRSEERGGSFVMPADPKPGYENDAD